MQPIREKNGKVRWVKTLDEEVPELLEGKNCVAMVRSLVSIYRICCWSECVRYKWTSQRLVRKGNNNAVVVHACFVCVQVCVHADTCNFVYRLLMWRVVVQLAVNNISVFN